MISVSVFYPNIAGKKFDMAYYCDRHIPMVQRMVGASCKGVTVVEGMSGEQPQSKPPYRAMAHLLFDSVESFQAAFGPHGREIMADIPNYTDIEPILQIGEVKMTGAAR